MQSLVTRLSKSANATAWGTLCAVVGHSLSTWLQTSGLSFVGQYQLTFIGYITGAAIYTLLSRRYRHISGCLGFAALMFEEDKRAHCLQRGGPHWNKIIRFNSSHRGLLGHSEVVPCSIRSAALGAQTQQGSWSNLNRVKAGQGIEVIESSMKRHAGKFVTVTDELLTLEANGEIYANNVFASCGVGFVGCVELRLWWRKLSSQAYVYIFMYACILAHCLRGEFWFCRRSVVNSYRALGVGSLVLLIVIAGCGTGGGSNSNNVTLTVSPAAVTIPANGQVTLQATVNGLCTGCIVTPIAWFISDNIGRDPKEAGHA